MLEDTFQPEHNMSPMRDIGELSSEENLSDFDALPARHSNLSTNMCDSSGLFSQHAGNYD